ncbi:LysR substrate-binding domain-containing protein [Anderseniella sp. Alg231-50]|uniref:LysR substrate-binding domain-containing protein n=1 Tax=Anderseniella sp. Alg231-50 TaxID=1922226 RepID=UPI000D55DE67
MNKSERIGPSSELLQTFVVIAECGNLTKAADILGRTQSAISVQVRKLEDNLSTRLFERHARGMELTEHGRKLEPIARGLVSEIHSLGGLFEPPLKGRLRVGIPDDYADTILERALVAFATRHPGVEVVAQSGCTSGFEAAVRSNQLDIAVCSGPDLNAADVFSSEPNVWVAHESLKLDRTQPVPLAILDRGCWWSKLPVDALDGLGRKWKPAYTSESFASIKAAIRAGLAVGVLPRCTIEECMTELTEHHGFPSLPVSKRAIFIAQDAPADLARAMAEAIRGAMH